jgi:hypothetical protein
MQKGEILKRLFQIGALCAVVAIALSFLPTNSTPASATPSTAAGTSRVRVVHASADTPAVDVYVNSQKVLSSVSFKGISNYLDVPAGATQVQVTVAGSLPGPTPPISATVPLVADKAYTIAAVGSLTGTPPSNLKATVVEDNLALPAANQGRVQVYHFANAIPPVNVRTKGGPNLIQNLAYPDGQAISVNAGQYELEVVASTVPTPTVLPLPLTVEPGKIYSVFALNDTMGKPSFEIREQSASGRVRIIHASPNAPNVDVYVDGSRVLNNIPFFNVSSFLDVPAGARLLQVTPANAPVSSAVISTTASIQTGKDYSVAAVGLLPTANLANTAFRGEIIPENLGATTATSATVRVYHFSPDTPAVSVRVKNGPTVISNLAFPSASNMLQLSAGTYSLEVFPTTAMTPTIPLTLTVAAGQRYDVFATNVFSKLAFKVQNTAAKLRVIHASPDAPNVDVYLDGTKVQALTNVPFFTASGYLSVPTGGRFVEITATGQPRSSAVFSGTVSVELGRSYTAAATGLISSTAPITQAFGVRLFEDDLSPVQPCQTRVRVYHFSPDAPPVNVFEVNGPTLAEALPFGSASAYANIRAGTYNLAVAPTASLSTIVINLPGTALRTGQVYDVFATDKVAKIAPRVTVTPTEGGTKSCLALPGILNIIP